MNKKTLLAMANELAKDVKTPRRPQQSECIPDQTNR
jgi:hypothetical protein